MAHDATPRAAASEASPLLPRPDDDDAPPPPRLHGRRFTILLTITIFFVALGAGMVGLPSLQILEDIICRRSQLGAEGGFDQGLCKGTAVQGELSFVVAMLSMFESIPGMV